MSDEILTTKQNLAVATEQLIAEATAQLRAELDKAKADYYAALKQGAEQARIAGNWQVDHIKLEAELEECRGEREQLSYQKKMLLKDTQEVVSKLEAERDTLKGENERLRALLFRARSALDKLMGDSDLDSDDSLEMRVCQDISKAIE